MAGLILRRPSLEKALKMNSRMLETHPKNPISLITDGKVKGGRSASSKTRYCDFFSAIVIFGFTWDSIKFNAMRWAIFSLQR